VQNSDVKVSQGNAATYLRCGGQTNMGFVVNSVLFAMVKEFCKSITNWQVTAIVMVAPFFDS